MADTNFMKTIVDSQRTVNALSGLIGRELGAVLGVVSNRKDPMKMGRVKCFIAAKGTKTETDWLFRVEPWGRISSPVPDVGVTVTVEYIDGDPHKGTYTGVLTNKLTPHWEDDGLQILVGQDLEIQLLEDYILFRAGKLKVELRTDGTFSVNGATSVYINDGAKQVTTLTAGDNDSEGNGGDSLTSTGWTPA